METALHPEASAAEALMIHDWRVDQLSQLGIPSMIADAHADAVDWHEVAALVRRGCPPLLALEIAR